MKGIFGPSKFIEENARIILSNMLRQVLCAWCWLFYLIFAKRVVSVSEALEVHSISKSRMSVWTAIGIYAARERQQNQHQHCNINHHERLKSIFRYFVNIHFKIILKVRGWIDSELYCGSNNPSGAIRRSDKIQCHHLTILLLNERSRRQIMR
jgi:hypothetical protein